MTEHLTEARACLSRVDQAATHFSAATWLTATCEQIIAHLEAQQTPHRKEPPMTDPKLHALLDLAQFGDRLTLTHSNGKHTASISGPVLTDQTHDPAVGIHLLDGQPHVVRNSTGVVWAPVVQAALHRGGEVIAEWDAADHLEAQQTEASLQRGLADITAGRTVDLGSFAQPATAPPAAQQGDSGHRDGGEAARPKLNAQPGYTPTTDEVEHRYAYDELYSMDCEADHHAFRRWLDSIRAEAWDEAVDTLWDEAIDILSRPWGDMIQAQIADLDRRNPYRQEQP